MAKPGATGITRIINAAGYSWLGIKAGFKHESAFRQELFLALILVPLAIWLAGSGVELALMIGSVLLLIVVELLNSAIEAVVDRISDEKHELAGRAKDMGSAAVLFTIVILVVVWSAILLPRYS